MPDDAELLHRYASEGSEEAFRELVRRHLNVVYGAALRRTGGDAHRAEDVAQIVFTELARKARTLASHRALTAWLYTTTRNIAIKHMLSEQRRQAREERAASLLPAGATHPFSSGPSTDWAQVRPILDGEMDRLSSTDREAILLRYFENRSFKELSDVLQVTEDSARMRVSRALEKLRERLARVGITSSTAALAALLVENTRSEAPAGAANGISNAALAGGGTAGAAGLEILAALTGGKLAIGAAAAAAILSLGVMAYRRAGPPAALPSEMVGRSAARRGSVPISGQAAAPAAPEQAVNLSLAAILAERDQLKAFGLYARRLMQLKPEEFDAEFPSLRQIPRADQREMFLQLYLRQWGTVDPRGALAALDRRKTMGAADANSVDFAEYLKFTSAVYKAWAAEKPVEAVEAAFAAVSDLEWVAEARARTSSATMPAAMSPAKLVASDRRDRIRDAIGAVIDARRFEDAAALILSHAALSDATQDYLRAGKEEGARPFVVDSALIQRLAGSWAVADPVAAAKWITEGWPADSDRIYAISGFLKAMGPESPAVATGMILSLEPMQRRTAAKALMEGYIEHGNRSGALDWIMAHAGENSAGEWDHTLVSYIGLSATAGKLLEASAGDRMVISRIKNPDVRGDAATTFALNRGEIAPRESVEMLQEFAPDSVKWKQNTNPSQRTSIWAVSSIPGMIGAWGYIDQEAALEFARTAPGFTVEQRAAMISMAETRGGRQP